MPLMSASKMYFLSMTQNAENVNDDIFFVEMRMSGNVVDLVQSFQRNSQTCFLFYSSVQNSRVPVRAQGKGSTKAQQKVPSEGPNEAPREWFDKGSRDVPDKGPSDEPTRAHRKRATMAPEKVPTTAQGNPP